MRYFLIINSRSNPRRLAGIDDAINKVSQYNSDLRARIELRYTEYAGHACDIASEIAEQYGETAAVVVCGGDGSIHEVANVLAFTKTPLICIPFGTGNDFANDIIDINNNKLIIVKANTGISSKSRVLSKSSPTAKLT